MKLINEITTEQKDEAFETYRNSQKMGYFSLFCIMLYGFWLLGRFQQR